MEKEGLERYQPPVAHLFVLSRELRDQIYRYVLAGKKWSIDAEGRLQHQPPNSLALAQVCQQLYMETRLIPFTSSTFHTSSPDGWRHLCDRIALTQKESVTSVELDMGVCGQFRAYHDNAIFPRQSAWRIDNGLSMHECTGLKRLHVFLEIKDWQRPFTFLFIDSDFEEERADKIEGTARAVMKIRAEIEDVNPGVHVTVQLYIKRERGLIALDGQLRHLKLLPTSAGANGVIDDSGSLEVRRRWEAKWRPGLCPDCEYTGLPFEEPCVYPSCQRYGMAREDSH